jgi:hypothetical protein
VVSYHEVAQDTAEVGLMRFVGALAVILPLLTLAQVLATLNEYRQPAVAIATWVGVLGVAAWLVPRLRRGGLSPGATAAAIAVAAVAVAVVGAERRPHHHPAVVDLAILGTVWLLALVVLSRPARVWIPGGLLVFAVHSAFVVLDGGLTQVTVSQLMAAGYILTTILLAFAILRPTIDLHVKMAARRAVLASRSVAERAAAAAVGQERRDRLAILESDVLPLLRGIASGTLDPAADSVRGQCARHAAALRNSLTHSPAAVAAAGDGDLAATLEPALEVARRRGLPVTVQVIGDPGIPGAPVARAAVAAVDAVLSALPPHQALLSVLATGDDVELYLTFGAPLRADPGLTRFGQDLPAAARWHAGLAETEAGGGCLEISWRKDTASRKGTVT